MYDRVSIIDRSYDVMVSILDFESSNPSSNLGRTSLFVNSRIFSSVLFKIPFTNFFVNLGIY